MIIQVSIVLSGTCWQELMFWQCPWKWWSPCCQNVSRSQQQLLSTTVTQDYNVHSPDKSYSTLLKYYRQPKLSLAISCTWKCLSLSAIKDINLLTDLTFALQKQKNYVVLQKMSCGFLKGSLLLFLFIASVNRHLHLKCNLT